MQEQWLKGKCLVIIGGTTGIGLSAARAFIDHGANVVAIGRNQESAKNASDILKTAIVETGDASREGTATKAIQQSLWPL
jgi:NAD(P)-dependent dehydrogenase (short-subunit alcohol dehydrogenase family)